MRETHEGPSQTCCGYLPTPIADTTHLRRLRLGDLSRWVRRGCSGRAEAKARASSPRPTRSGTSRYKKKRGSTPSNLTSARLPNTVFAKHHGAPWRSAGGVIRQCGSSRRCPGPSHFALRNRVRPEVSVSARRLCEHGNAHRRAADPMSTATSRTNRAKADPMSTATSRTNRAKADPMSTATNRESSTRTRR